MERLRPRSDSKTLADVDGFEQITTDFEPDADLYEMTIADALDTGMPLLLVFSTPAYCQTATCGPQLGVIKELKAEYADRMNFIHIEVYDNPHEIEGDLSRGGHIADRRGVGTAERAVDIRCGWRRRYTGEIRGVHDAGGA